MTPAATRGEGDDVAKSAQDAVAHALAEEHRHIFRVSVVGAVSLELQPTPVARALARAQKYLAARGAKDTPLRKPAEWFLDNYYLIRRVARQVTDDVPPAFLRRLPHIARGPAKGVARVDALARALVVRSSVEIDVTALQSFVQAYQEVSPLTVAELWALPTMLRISVLHGLLQSLGGLDVPLDGSVLRCPARRSPPDAESAEVDPGMGVEKSIRALRLLAEIDWKRFFQETSRVEAVLRRDPAGTYARMDFETCDAYRKAVEALAWATEVPEEVVAERVVDLARQAGSDPRHGHVGYYLVGLGRGALEDQVGFHPRGIERLRRALRRWPTVAYFSVLALLTSSVMFVCGASVAHGGASPASVAVTLLLAILPGSIVGVTVLQWGLARALPPRVLPKLDFAKGLPEDARTLVVIPTLLGRSADVVGMLRQIELHYLSNPDPRLQFALLTDDLDSTTPTDDPSLLDSVAQGVVVLNAAYGKGKPGPFHLLHREARWNAAEGRFMGWERKRGKLEELNRLLRGAKDTSFARHVGDPAGLDGIRFVITVDGDTQLPMGSARRLVGLLAHPLNQAVFDGDTGRVVSGYTIVQPRVEMSPSSSRETLFARIFAGDIGFDIYTHAVSESYQDLFGAGIYVGKGIYDVDAFMRSVQGRVPENALASHDLFEGIHGRTALASDIALFEDYPSHYAAYTRRMHRWVRGDWQLLPWLFPSVPSAGGGRMASTLAPIDRWKIFDNLRRSLTSPLLFLALVMGLVWLPGPPWLWTLGTLAILLLPSLPALAHDRSRRAMNLARCVLTVAFLANEAAVVADALIRVAVRLAITRKHLLQWTSAANTAFGLGRRSPRALMWSEMIWSPILALATAALVACARPSSLVVAAPFVALWFVAPEIARWVSRTSISGERPLRQDERRKLRLLARRTWRFFDVFVGPHDQWLPIDNYQEDPAEQTAHRTSPTNIGLMLLSTLAAYDLGYLSPSELSLRIRSAFESIDRLEHYQGHLFNWYETKNLQPLIPRYVSTVDSGNFAGCLIALEQGCLQVADAEVLRVEAWEGLVDSLDLLEDSLRSVDAAKARALRGVITRMRHGLEAGRNDLEESYAAFRSTCDDGSVELDRELLILVESGTLRHDQDALRELRTSMIRFHDQVRRMRHDIECLLPWLRLKDEPAAVALVPPQRLRLGEVPGAARELTSQLARWENERRERGELSPELEASALRLRSALKDAETHSSRIAGDLRQLAARAQTEVRGMDFRLLYDRERRLFRIGYNATQDVPDPHHYDLLASEARLASYLAIVKGDVPEAHWATLGRPLIQVSGAPVLLSWGGSMFEYLMPSLLMRSREGTLLAITCARVVDAHIAYGKETDAPWGISESAYARLDAGQTYQYQSFGVPGLGFKRGLEDDLVVTPYASMLAVSLRPHATVENLERLKTMGMLGTYGLFEAVDMRPERPLDGRPFTVVRSYMAHHQGMLLVAIDNVLNHQVMVERFHADSLVATGEVLLNERAPAIAPPEWPLAERVERSSVAGVEAAPYAPPPWSPEERGHPQAFVLTNGRLSSLVTDTGGGGLRWEGIAVTRYQPDVVGDGDGLWLYLRDEETGRVWLATSEGGRTTYAAQNAEFHQRDNGISVRVEVTVAPADDVEVRHVILHNESDRTRHLTVTTAGEPVLLPMGQAATHPAFGKMFLESQYVPDLDALLFTRRPRAATDDRVAVVHRLAKESSAVTFAGYESDRAAFFGRCGSARSPRWLADGRAPHAGGVGAVVDPIMSLTARVELKPKRTATLAFVTTVARTSSAALDLARRYGSMHAARWALRDAEQESGRRLARARLRPEVLPAVQRLFSALLFADPRMRASSDVVAAGRPNKRRLWGRGISGDDPILLVRVSDASAPIVRETIAAQRYLRACGVRLDLVLLDEEASGYVSGTLRSVLALSDVDEWMGRHGGIFALAADQLQGDERRHLEASARVVLDTRDGSLGARMARAAEAAPRLPRFEPTLVDDGVPRAPLRPTLLFDNGVGGFSEDGSEYVISVRPTAPTPAPWSNVLANPTFGCMVSESSLGSTWSLNAGENRLTPWRNDPVFDAPSEALYLRDEETAAVWSPTPLPAGGDGECLVRHGVGYTSYTRETHGLVQELTIFVPHDAELKVARLKLKNTLPRHRRLTATYYAEWVLGTSREEQRPFIASEFEGAHACLLASCNWNADFGGRVAFLASQREVHGFTTDRAEFLGRRGDYARPEALERWGLGGSLEAGADPCAVIQVHLELRAGEEIETHFILGQAANRDEALRCVARFREAPVVETAWKTLGTFWEGLLGSVRVRTPDPAMDLMLNRWLRYQTFSSRFFGRTALYQSSGAFGYRDQLQDVLAFLHGSPERARAHILEAAKHQFEEGDVLHWWHPPAGRGVRTRCSDDMAWLPFVTADYVFATGDVSILSETVPFLTGAPLADGESDRYAAFSPSASPASLFEHCRRALVRAVTEGRHGLPLMGDGDWNDGMNRVGSEGRGESVWLGWFLCATMDRFAALCERRSDGAEAQVWRGRAKALRQRLDGCAWDGAWYVRAFHDDGSLIGSSKERECRIDSIAQSWAVLSATSGGAESASAGGRVRLAVRAADRELVREADRLVLLLTPPFDVTRHDPGYIRAYPPGMRENGGQYTHAATWLGWAHVGLGDGERAERIFRILNPILRTKTREEAEVYRVEPYVLAGDVYSVAPWVGRGGWTWYTGAAAWAWRLGVEGILGLRMEDGGLRIDPCIPRSWKGFEGWIRFGAQDIHVAVENPDAVSGGIAMIALDGALLDTNRIPLDRSLSGRHEVRVRLGESKVAAQSGGTRRGADTEPLAGAS